MRALAGWLLLLAAASAHAQAPEALLLEVQLDGRPVLDALGAVRRGDTVLLPLGELARTLTLPVTVAPDAARADGWLLLEEHDFHLDGASGTLVIGGVASHVDPARLYAADGELYAPAELLARWWPVDLAPDLAAMALRVHARASLPLQARWAREQRAGALHGAAAAPHYPRLVLPARLATLPFVDQTVSLAAGAGHVQAASATYASAELLGMQANLFASVLQGRGASVRGALGRYDDDGELLGPLHARSAVVGSVAAPPVANISAGTAIGTGLQVSNRPLFQPASFGSQSLQGDLAPGWDVELYLNDALLAVQQARPDGRYRFDDIALVYGDNALRLVFHGPLGQTRVERQRVLLSQAALAPGKWQYSASAQRDGAGHPRQALLLDAGLPGGLVASIGAVHTPLYGVDHRYVLAGLRQFWRSAILEFDAVRDDAGGRLARAGLRTRVGGVAVRLSHAALDGFASEIYLPSFEPLRARDELALDGAPVAGMPLSLLARRDRFASGSADSEVLARASLYRNGFAVSQLLHWQRLHGNTLADAGLHLSRRLAGIGLAVQLQYSVQPVRAWRSAAFTAERDFGDGYVATAGVTHSLHQRGQEWTLGLNKSLGAFGAGLRAACAGRGRYQLGFQLFFSLAGGAPGAPWQPSALPRANTGIADVHVFLDKNLNGIMDGDDTPIAGAAITVNGAQQGVRTDASGHAQLLRLVPNRPADIALDPGTLEDPQWQPRIAGVRLVPRAGSVAAVTVAVIATGEIDGATYLVDAGTRRPLGALVVELVAADGAIAASTRSAGDGYFVMTGLAPGSYRLRIAPEQLASLGLVGPPQQPLTIGAGGTLVNGRELLVERQHPRGR